MLQSVSFTVGRGVGASAGDLVHTNLPVPGVGRTGERHRDGGVGGEGGDGGVQVDVLPAVVAAHVCRSVC